MKFQIDTKYLVDFFRHIVSVPSPTEFYVRLNPVLKQYAEELGCEMTFDRRNNAYITLEGEDNSKTVLFTAHADTVGLVVRCIEGNGTIRIRNIGGINLATLDGETVTDSVAGYCARMSDQLDLSEPLMKFAASARAHTGKSTSTISSAASFMSLFFITSYLLITNSAVHIVL